MRQSELKNLFFLVGLLILSACTKERRALPPDVSGSGSSGAATLTAIQSDIFLLSCATAGCHDNRVNSAANLHLTNASQSHDEMVNIRSVQAIGETLITPNDPSQSYLVAKLRGTHLLVGGNGSQMPQYSAPLKDEDIVRIEDWISNGAIRN